MIAKPPVIICLLSIVISSLACNMPSPATTPTTVAIPPTITESADPTSAATEATIEAPTSDGIAEQLKVALINKDFAAIKAMMGDAFLIRYVDGDQGLISVNDAVRLLQTDLLTGPNPIVFDGAVNPETALGGPIDLNDLELELAQSLFSIGWGTQNNDHTVVLIAREASGSEYFAGIIYARQGFSGIAPTLTVAQPTDEPVATTPEAESANPAPRGSIEFESDFRQNWPIFNEDHVTSQLTSEGYLLSVTNTWSGWAFTSQIDIASYYVEVTVIPKTCPEAHGSYGLIFNHTDSDEFLVFVIECNGTFTLWERTPTANSKTLLTDDLPDGLNALSGEHRLGVLTEGNSLILYIDDFRVGSVPHSVVIGDFGPYVETSGSSTISALFTRLQIFNPK